MSDQITLRELIEVRKQEMESMRPGLMTVIRVGDKEAVIESPNTVQRGTFKMNSGK